MKTDLGNKLFWSFQSSANLAEMLKNLSAIKTFAPSVYLYLYNHMIVSRGIITYGHRTSNLVESLNSLSVLLRREGTPLSVLHELLTQQANSVTKFIDWQKLVDQFFDEEGNESGETMFMPAHRAKAFNDSWDKRVYYTSKKIGDYMFEVTITSENGTEIFLVGFLNGTSCCIFQEMESPCPHACCAAESGGFNKRDFRVKYGKIFLIKKKEWSNRRISNLETPKVPVISGSTSKFTDEVELDYRNKFIRENESLLGSILNINGITMRPPVRKYVVFQHPNSNKSKENMKKGNWSDTRGPDSGAKRRRDESKAK